MKKGTGFLSVLSLLAGAAAGGVGTVYIKNKAIKKESKKVEKFKGYYNLLNQWLMLKNEGKALEKYFVDNNYRTMAIYGMGEIGHRLYEEMKNSSITVKYAIDKDAVNTYSDIDVRDMEDDLEEVDVIVVSAVFAYDDIRVALEEKIDCPIISLEDIIFGL